MYIFIKWSLHGCTWFVFVDMLTNHINWLGQGMRYTRRWNDGRRWSFLHWNRIRGCICWKHHLERYEVQIGRTSERNRNIGYSYLFNTLIVLQECSNLFFLAIWKAPIFNPHYEDANRKYIWWVDQNDHDLCIYRYARGSS